MKLTGYLIIGRNKAMRVTKTAPRLAGSEIALNLTLTIPDRFFTRPTADIVITIPEDAVLPTEAAVEVISERVADALQLNVNDVYDGLSGLKAKAGE